MEILTTLSNAEKTLVSHVSAIRKELNYEEAYSKADKDERAAICRSLLDSLSVYVAEAEDLTTVQLAAIMSTINSLLATRRALLIATSPGSSQHYDRTKNTRDLLALKLKSDNAIFLDEESSKLDTIPEYFS
tara:strand:- start:357 stop:752 length:396 start_codon:yes stop_codon:yes gene_type:complete